MSEQEQKLSYMQQLDQWTEAVVIMPLANPSADEDFDHVVKQVKKVIREKVLQSYRNGLKAGAVAGRKEKTNEKKK
jgi:hypothetical protein